MEIFQSLQVLQKLNSQKFGSKKINLSKAILPLSQKKKKEKKNVYIVLRNMELLCQAIGTMLSEKS